MLNLYQSNMLDALMHLYLAVRNSSQESSHCDPLLPETLLVPSVGMQRWLAFALAREQGIAANLNFRLPAAFAWQLITQVFPDIPARSPFDREALVWRVLRELPAVLPQANGAAIASHWQAADARGRYELAWRVADIFDQYLIYRPDWIAAWEKNRRLDLGSDEAWQAALWQRLSKTNDNRDDKNTVLHRAGLISELEKRLKAGEVPGLPAQISVFGISSLPPMIWRLLNALGQRTTVNIFLLNPSQEYWGQLKRGDTGEGAHALLASLGQQGRDFINTVASSGVNEPVGSHAFVTPQNNTALAALQADLLLQRVRSPKERMVVNENDSSLQVHVCHSALREVEVLHDQLLMLFEKNPELMPEDILVQCSDIQRYAPLIDAVFGTRTQPAAIPYTIADRRLDIEQPLLRRFSELLALPGSRFEVERVLALLEEPALLARFGLQESDVPLIRRWCEELHLRWGRDAQDRRARSLPTDVPLSWRDALSRLLLGFSLPLDLAPENDQRFAKMAPASVVMSVAQAQVMARLTQFVESLLAWEQRLTGARALLEWANTLDALIGAFFAETEESRDALLHLHDVTAELREQARISAENSPQEFSVLNAWLRRQLQGLESRRGFLHGAVTVCAMVPMRSLPFKVIAVLGLDDGVFPRQQKPWSFDLMATHPAAGDRSRRLDDRYLFLETLLAARDVLYLSHIGASDTDGSVRAASPVVAELLDQLRLTVITDSEKYFRQRFITRHALQPFSPVYFNGNKQHFSFDQKMAAASHVINKVLSEFISEALGKNNSNTTRHKLAAFSSSLPAPDADLLNISLPRFEQFLSHPTRFFLRERLGVQLAINATALGDEEPVEITSVRELRRRLFKTPELDVSSLQAEGLLPSGVWGQRLWKEEAEYMHLLWQRREALGAECVPPLAVSWQAHGVTLSGHITELTTQGIVRVSLENKIYATDVLQLQLHHLLLCAQQPEGVECRSRLLGLHDEVVLEPVENPTAALNDFLAAYAEGLIQPLPLFRRASPAYMLKKEITKAQNAFVGSEYARGDIKDAWTALLWRDADPLDERFIQWTECLYGPLAGVLPK
jgi:exodeoxyribonuclease V gamma subunit